MNGKFKESKYYQDWTTKAKRDFTTANLNHKHDGFTDVTCYYCHQTAEKILKAYLLYKGIKKLPRIHILAALIALCQDYDSSFIEIKAEGNNLDQYFVETKYPSDPPMDYPVYEVEEAIKQAEKILNFVLKKIA
jgi:HEPN domain-containing protein